MANIEVIVLGQVGPSMGGTSLSIRSRILLLTIDCRNMRVRDQWLAIGSIYRGAGR
jgi:hypothetical protein